MVEGSWRDRYNGSPAPGTGSNDNNTAAADNTQTAASAGTVPDDPKAPMITSSKSEVLRQADRISDISQRFRAPGLLLFGASACILGFAFITVIGMVDFYTQKRNESLRLPYESGNGYFPATVSEMVHNQESPGGRVFHTFGMMAGVCIFMSWYPIHLRNVYTGPDCIPFFGVYWTTTRQLLPAMGLWLLIGVNTYPTPVAMNSAGKTKMGCVFLHLVGAGMMFLGYLVCEMKCLALLGFSRSKNWKLIGSSEYRWRTALAMVILISFSMFSFIQVSMTMLKKSDYLKEGVDVWAFKGDIITSSDGQKHRIMADPQIVNTASGMFLKMKIASFVCEDVAGLAMVLSHIAIWYFCEERHHQYGDYDLEAVIPRSHDDRYRQE